MSNKILNLVRDARIGDSTAKEILRVIADQSNDAGTGVWSSYAYIAWCVERGRSTVIEKCALLRELGVLSWKRGKTNLWSVSTSRLEELAEVWGKEIESPDDGLPEVEEVQTTDNKVQTPDPSPLEPKEHTNSLMGAEEPTYVDDIDGVPAEHIMVYHDILTAWKKDFPSKTQPRATSTKLQGRGKARLKVSTFKAGLWAAMTKAKNSPSLMHDSWFQLEYLLRNDDNYEKVAAGEFDWKDGDAPQQVTQPTVHDNVDVDEWRNRRTNG